MKILKLALSAFIVYHLMTILIMPIGNSLLGRKLGHFLTPYANQLNFNTTWQFFSPGPSPVFFLEYDVEKSGDGEAVAGEPLTYPPLRDRLTWNDGWNRRLFGMRFFSLNEDLLGRYFAPFLCRQNPGAQAISVLRVFEKIDDIEHAGEWADFKELSHRLDMPRQRFTCAEKAAGQG